MYRNVMPPILVRRLGACINRFTNVRLATSSSKHEKTANDHYNDHLERLSVLQAEDARLLRPMNSKIEEYTVLLGKSREFLTTLSDALELLRGMKSPCYTLEQHRAGITDALASLDRLKNKRLPSLLAHIEDLELEPFPEPGSDEPEIDFLQRVGGMSARERKDALDTMTMELRALTAQATESVLQSGGRLEITGAVEEELAKLIEVRANPFVGITAKKAVFADLVEKKTGDRPMIGLSANEQSDDVITEAEADDYMRNNKVPHANFGLNEINEETTTWKPVVSTVKTPKPRSEPRSEPEITTWKPIDTEPRISEPKPKSFGKPHDTHFRIKPKPPSRDLNSLQAQLEASWKKTARS
jgi:hypothetical protein